MNAESNQNRAMNRTILSVLLLGIFGLRACSAVQCGVQTCKREADPNNEFMFCCANCMNTDFGIQQPSHHSAVCNRKFTADINAGTQRVKLPGGWTVSVDQAKKRRGVTAPPSQPSKRKPSSHRPHASNVAPAEPNLAIRGWTLPEGWSAGKTLGARNVVYYVNPNTGVMHYRKPSITYLCKNPACRAKGYLVHKSFKKNPQNGYCCHRCKRGQPGHTDPSRGGRRRYACTQYVAANAHQ